MNKKALLLMIAILATAVLATSMVGTANACGPRKSRTIETFTIPYNVPPRTFTLVKELVTGSEKFVCDGTIRISHGTLREYTYNGRLGTGTAYLETLTSISHVSGYIFILGAWRNATSVGGGIYKWTLEITDGPYGTGTLKGIGKVQWDINYLETPTRYEQWDTAKLEPVSGNLDLIKVNVEGYLKAPQGWYWTTTTVVS